MEDLWGDGQDLPTRFLQVEQREELVIVVSIMLKIKQLTTH
jgi:hypothetical protein